MLEELEVLRGIVGDLSSVGLWVFIGYIMYSLAKVVLTFVASLWLIHKIALMWFDYKKAPFTKEECIELENKLNKEKMDKESTLHKYSIMKERLTKEVEEIKSKQSDGD